jgi:signal transduction histidine kinase
VQEAKKMIGDVTQRLRTLSYNLRPPELDTIGLNAALSDLCQVYEKQANIAINFTGAELPQHVSDTITLSLYRFLQEALINITEHAAATRVEVELTYDDGEIHLRVSDNGRGFDQAARSLNEMSGLGLLGIRERFTTLHGSIQITSAKGMGTEVTARVPWS